MLARAPARENGDPVVQGSGWAGAPDDVVVVRVEVGGVVAVVEVLVEVLAGVLVEVVVELVVWAGVVVWVVVVVVTGVVAYNFRWRQDSRRRRPTEAMPFPAQRRTRR